MFSKIFFICFLVGTLSANASWESAKSTYSSGRMNKKQIRSVVIELVRDGYVFSALPWMKEYLAIDTKYLDARIDSALSRIISKAGIKQFETLPLQFLKRSKSDNIRYIIAKKYLRKNNYDSALTYLENISDRHAIYPFALNMQATIYALRKDAKKASLFFDRCVDASKRLISSSPSNNKLKINRDYCTLGKARASFGARKFDESDLLYLDIPKSSRVWPEILFEEAWNSYYQKNYNRSLGKLVSYKAPVFAHIFNPEIEVLNALSYLKMCLYSDAKKVTNDFYQKYLQDARKLRLYLNRHKSQPKHFYNTMVRFERNKNSGTPLLTTLLGSILREEAYIDLKKQIVTAAKEYNRIRKIKGSKFKRSVILNIQEYIKVQKIILGAYVKGRLISSYATMYRAFEGMSYIKLEVLAQRKAKLYSLDGKGRSRGDLKYIERNEKQYFWDFNGEFWADELGDYVFALKSEC
jgi:hypothetical protein